MKIESVWSACLNELQLNLTSGQFALVQNLKLVDISDLENGSKLKVTLTCQSVFHQVEIKKRFGEEIKQVFDKVTKKICEVELVVDNREIEKVSAEESPLFSENFMTPQEKANDLISRVGLQKELSLENFAVSSTNEMAYAAAKAVSQSPGAAYNPLYFYGGVGVGKTHLMQGVGLALLKKTKVIKIIYCSGEEFTNEIIEAIQRKSTAKFRARYRTVKLLLIDDIQFIAGKTSVQEEFFHTFNSITKEGGQVIMTSDKPPKEIDSLEDRLRSRFEGGLTIDIGQPNFELRCAIIMIKARQMGLDLDTQVAQYLAQRESDTRSLLGKLTMILTIAKMRKTTLSLDLAEELFPEQQLGENKIKPLNPNEVIARVAEFYNSETTEVLGKSRLKSLTLPRHIAMYLLKSDLDMGYVEIGRFFSGRDHTSVIHAVRKIKTLLNNDESISNEVSEIRNIIK